MKLGRLPFLGAAFASLAIAAWAGLERLGWALPWPVEYAHGPLILCGFLGTLIGVERAVARAQAWTWLSPLCGIAGAACLLAHATAAACWAFLAQAVLFTAVTAQIAWKWPSRHAAVGLLAGLAWTVGNALQAHDEPIYRLVWWWAAFLILTIASERLEMTRLRRLPAGATPAFLALCAALLAGCAQVTWAAEYRLLGVVLALMAGWLAAFDIARRTVSMTGLTRFTAVCLLSGYAWLGVAGLLLASGGGRAVAGPWYDASLHAVFLGFVMAMIFGHAPIILPAVLEQQIPFHRGLYLPLVLLQGTLAMRIFADLDNALLLRAWAGLGNVLSIALFIVLAAAGRLAQGTASGSRSSAAA